MTQILVTEIKRSGWDCAVAIAHGDWWVVRAKGDWYLIYEIEKKYQGFIGEIVSKTSILGVSCRAECQWDNGRYISWIVGDFSFTTSSDYYQVESKK